MSTGFCIEDGVPHIGSKAYRWASKVRSNSIEISSGGYRSRGFWLTFENGWTLSIQFGEGNYCANRDAGYQGGEWHEDCPNAEIAAWPDGGEMVDLPGGDTVLGWQTTADVLAWIEDISTRPSAAPAGAPVSSSTQGGPE